MTNNTTITAETITNAQIRPAQRGPEGRRLRGWLTSATAHSPAIDGTWTRTETKWPAPTI